MPLEVPLEIDVPIATSTSQPVTFGVPFAQGLVHDESPVAMELEDGRTVLTQSEFRSHWSDRSVRWLGVTAILPPFTAGGRVRALLRVAESSAIPPLRKPEVPLSEIESFSTPPFSLKPSVADLEIRRDGKTLLKCQPIALDDPEFLDREETVSWPCQPGPDAAVCVRSQSTFLSKAKPLLSFEEMRWIYPALKLVRIDLGLSNRERASHPGGLWDLDDAHAESIALGVSLISDQKAPSEVVWQPARGLEPVRSPIGGFCVSQFSSGGENYRSRNHCAATGAVPELPNGPTLSPAVECALPRRLSPTFVFTTEGLSVAATIHRFWESFPTQVRGENRSDQGPKEAGYSVHLDLMPSGVPSPFSVLQAGERFERTVWLHYDEEELSPSCLDWVHAPALVRVDPAYMAQSGAVPFLDTVGPTQVGGRLLAFAHEALEGPRNLFWKREVIDEYGWRNFGDAWADHEEAYYDGPKPIISHYNNQYDLCMAFLLWWWLTGDRRWWELAEPLGRHVCDIDTYKTDRDRSVYNGGLFWHTDHYHDAGAATHRSYSRRNARPGIPYGGGPSNENNYTTGLFHLWQCAGDTHYVQAVLELASWVGGMDDGQDDLWYAFDREPTGLATRTREDSYHGPGRGAGNSINAILDSYRLMPARSFLKDAEELIRRSVHPHDDIDARELLDAERRWSYINYFAVIARYLDDKWHVREFDRMFWYARASLFAYADWMAKHETPFLDRADTLEYPTETWACLDIRKANVLHLAARYLDPEKDQDRFTRWKEKARWLADRGWSDLEKFDSKYVTRAIAIILLDGWKEYSLRDMALGSDPRQAGPHAIPFEQELRDFGVPTPFVPRGRRVKQRFKQPTQWPSLVIDLMRPSSWKAIGRFVRKRLGY